MHGKLKRYLLLLILGVAVAACAVAPAQAFALEWKQVPAHLKQGEGFADIQDQRLATGRVRVRVISSKAQAFERAAGRAAARAEQILFSTACDSAMDGLDQRERQNFSRYYSHVIASGRVHGLQIVQEWETEQDVFATVALPLEEMENIQCRFTTLQEVIDAYATNEQVSLDGLRFSLKHVERHTPVYHALSQQIGLVYAKGGIEALASGFLGDRSVSVSGTTLMQDLSLQYRMGLVDRNVSRARSLLAQSDWNGAMDLIAASIRLAPTSAGPYLLLSDFYLKQMGSPEMALLVAHKALRDGTSFVPAMGRIRDCLEKIGSPEAEVYSYLLDHTSSEGGFFFPKPWKETMGFFAEGSLPYMVMASYGQYVDSSPKFSQEAINCKEEQTGSGALVQTLACLAGGCDKLPGNVPSYLEIGRILFQNGRPAAALAFLQQALTLQPGNPGALDLISGCCRELGLDQAAQYYRDVAKSLRPEAISANTQAG